jgi:pyruvate formate lyase activating enzyme
VNKGLIFDIRRFTVHDGPGIRTTVFFKGCPLSCWWCHNPESRSFSPEESVKTIRLEGKAFSLKETIGQWMDVDQVMHELRMDRIFYAESSGGVTFSGGEPLLQPEFLLKLLMECKNRDIHTAIDTSGYADLKVLEKIHRYTDLFLYDLKLIDDADHIRYTGLSNKPILENLSYLLSEENRVVIRIPVIPGITDTKKHTGEIIGFLLDNRRAQKSTSPLKISLLPYHSIARNKYLRLKIDNKMKELKDPGKESLIPLKNKYEAAGFEVKIGG